VGDEVDIQLTCQEGLMPMYMLCVNGRPYGKEVGDETDC
jgi:hypothetical protein